MNSIQLLWSIAAITVTAATGCGTEVRIAQNEYPPVTPPPCDDGPPPNTAVIALDSVMSGAFIGETLHLEARLDGTPMYAVLGISDGHVWVANRSAELIGPANLAPAGPGIHARLRTDGFSTNADVIDTSSPENPILKQSLSFMVEVPLPWQTVFSVVDDHLLFCGALSPNPPPELLSVPLDGSTPPLPLENGIYNVCNGLGHDMGTANGKIWMAWGGMSDLFIYEATAKSLDRIADYQYNPDGIHAYGPVLSAATDGERIVFDAGNENEFFLYAVGSGEPIITHTVLGVQGPKRLLGVVDHIVYLATPEGVRAYDASNVGPSTDWATLPLLDYHADIPFGADLPRLIAANDRYLAVVDGADKFYLIPLGKSGPVEPLEIHAEPPPAAGCDGKQ